VARALSRHRREDEFPGPFGLGLVQLQLGPPPADAGQAPDADGVEEPPQVLGRDEVQGAAHRP